VSLVGNTSCSKFVVEGGENVGAPQLGTVDNVGDNVVVVVGAPD